MTFSVKRFITTAVVWAKQINILALSAKAVQRSVTEFFESGATAQEGAINSSSYVSLSTNASYIQYSLQDLWYIHYFYNVSDGLVIYIYRTAV